VSVLWTTTRE